MKISENLLAYINDADFHTKLRNVEYSTDLRAIVTLDYMIKRHELENEKAACAPTQTAKKMNSLY